MKHFDRLLIIWFFCTVSAFAQRNTSSTLSFGLPVLWGTQPSDGSPKAPLGLTGNVDNSTSTSFSSHFAYYKPFKNSLEDQLVGPVGWSVWGSVTMCSMEESN